MVTLVVPLLLTVAPLAPNVSPAQSPALTAFEERMRFKAMVLALEKQFRLDPDYAAMSVSKDGLLVKVHFKGNARERLARYTRDPRILPVSVPLSVSELNKLQTSMVDWMMRRGISLKEIGVNPHKGELYVTTLEPGRLLAAAHDDRVEMRHIKIYRVMAPRPESL